MSARVPAPRRPPPPSGAARLLLREPWRQTLAIVIAFAVTIPVTAVSPSLNWVTAADPAARLPLAIVLLVLAMSLYSAAFAVLTHLVLRRLDRPSLLAAARLSRARQSSRLLRGLGMRSTTGAESLQLLISACAMVYVLQTRPAHVPVEYLLGVTVLVLVTAWMSCAVGYAAHDCHGEAFRLDGEEDPSRRAYEEYLYIAVLVQTSSASADFAPLTREARRTLRGQSVLAHIMATVVVAVGASAIFAAL